MLLAFSSCLGSVANKVYHQILFDTCLNMPLKCWPQDSGRKRKKDSVKSSQGETKTGKRSKPPKKVSAEVKNCLFVYVTLLVFVKHSRST